MCEFTQHQTAMQCGAHGPVSALLSSDAGFRRVSEAEARFPLEYALDTPTPNRRTMPWRLTAEHFPGGVHVGGAQVDVYNKLLSAHTRVQTPASSNRPATELFGTAPYVAVGRGALRNPDASAAAWFPTVFPRKSVNRRYGKLAEITTHRFDYVDVPIAVEPDRTGMLTRAGPQYVRPPPLGGRDSCRALVR